MISKVFFTSLRLGRYENLYVKLERLVTVAGMETLGFQNKFVALKLHFGEPGNLAYLRPNYARKVAEIVKRNGAFLPHGLQHALCRETQTRARAFGSRL